MVTLLYDLIKLLEQVQSWVGNHAGTSKILWVGNYASGTSEIEMKWNCIEVKNHGVETIKDWSIAIPRIILLFSFHFLAWNTNFIVWKLINFLKLTLIWSGINIK